METPFFLFCETLPTLLLFHWPLGSTRTYSCLYDTVMVCVSCNFVFHIAKTNLHNLVKTKTLFIFFLLLFHTSISFRLWLSWEQLPWGCGAHFLTGGVWRWLGGGFTVTGTADSDCFTQWSLIIHEFMLQSSVWIKAVVSLLSVGFYTTAVLNRLWPSPLYRARHKLISLWVSIATPSAM